MKKRTKIMKGVIIGISVIFFTILMAHAGPPRPTVTKVKPGALKAAPSATVPKKIYKIEVVKFDLTRGCRVRLVLQNKGSGLTSAQHGKCTLKVGHGPPISFSSLDPAKRLCKKGGTITYMEAKPLLKKTNVTAVITLFNGSKRSWTKLLNPTCPRPHFEMKKHIPGKKATQPKRKISPISTKGSTRMFQPQPEPPGKPLKPQVGFHASKKAQHLASRKAGIPVPGGNKMFQPQPEPPGQPMKPMSNKMAMKFPRPKAIATLPKTVLQVKRLGGDIETWDNYASADTSLQKMDFRWKTEIESLHAARWQVSISPDFPYVIANGPVAPIPPKGQYGRFSIDLSAFSGKYSKPAVFYVRVKPLKYRGIGKTSQSAEGAVDREYKPSIPVRITLTEAGSGEQTQFNLPKTHLHVVLQKILVVYDSDDLSGGDLTFKFVVNGIQKIVGYADDAVDTGDELHLSNVSYDIVSPPNTVRVEVWGCDDDDPDLGAKFVTEGNFMSYCGNNHDMAIVAYEIFTGTKSGRFRIPYTPFSAYANGDSLKFEVHGYYEMYCDPCP